MASEPTNLHGQNGGAAPKKAKSEPFAKLPVTLRDRLLELTGAELKVWLAYTLHANKQGYAWPNRETLHRETGLSEDWISTARQGLVKKGWLERVGRKYEVDYPEHYSPRVARFTAPWFRPVIPPRRT